ncbi:transglutaminase family protein [Cyanobium sp. ATX-6F1]|uniref:transglutaminase family protein n=1 Tax=Cyanobium sp. ATX-6F1 TaxID=3137388 RepID=UPI0039BEA8A1
MLRQVLTLEVHPGGWSLFLPPLAREPLEQLLRLIAAASAGKSQPLLSGVLPLDITGHWQVLGLTADPGVLEVNLPVCANWQAYAGWMVRLEEAGATVGLRSWKDDDGHIVGTGGGNHLLWGGPDLETNPFFSRPAWLVGVLRFWQRHPSLAYLFSNPSVGPASQAPRPDEGSASWLDLELAHQVIEDLPEGDQRVLISETLRHLHADRSGNTHRSEISIDKFWNPAWAAGCQGLIEFRAIETLPRTEWIGAIALLWSALAVHLLEPAHRPETMEPFGPRLHDALMLPSALLADLEAVLARLAADGLMLDPKTFRTIWDWQNPRLLAWEQGRHGWRSAGPGKPGHCSATPRWKGAAPAASSTAPCAASN